MRKLAVVVDTFPRWSERFIARELTELLRRGVDLTVFCFKELEGNAAGDEDWHGLIERRVLLPRGLIPSFLTQRWVVDVAHIRRAAALADHVREDGFGHIHAHFASLPSTVAMLASEETGVPFSFSAHARDLFASPELLREKMDQCACVFTCHARGQDYLQRNFGGGDRVRLMRHGLPLERFPFLERTRDQRGAPLRILAAGRFVQKKGFDDALAALAHPALAQRDCVLHILGDGTGEYNLRERAASLGIEARVCFDYPRFGRELRQRFDAAGLFIAPYKQAPDGDVDGVPNVIIEAFAVGLPVIGTDAGSLPEVLTAETGTVVPQNDPAALAEAIAAFLDDPGPALAKTHAARALVEREYDIRTNIGPFVALLGEAADET
jgi:glycosyltransferase involved in cell wall biosynthesis